MTTNARQGRLITEAVRAKRKTRENLDHLARRLGIGPKTFQRIRNQGLEPTETELTALGIDQSVWSAAGDELTIDSILRPGYPPAYPNEFASAKRNMWITGLNLRRITDREYDGIKLITHVDDALKRNVKTKILLIEPEPEVCKYAAMQDWGTKDGDSYAKQVIRALSIFCGLRTEDTNSNLEIRTINYPLNFGIDAMDAESDGGIDEGIIYLRFYPIYAYKTDDQPIVRLTPKEHYWYDFYKTQFYTLWRLATDYNCRLPQENSSTKKPK